MVEALHQQELIEVLSHGKIISRLIIQKQTLPIILKSSTNIIGYWLNLLRSRIAIFTIVLLYYLYLYRHETIQMCVEMLNEYSTVRNWNAILCYYYN